MNRIRFIDRNFCTNNAALHYDIDIIRESQTIFCKFMSFDPTQ